jgi:hypothetical protein
MGRKTDDRRILDFYLFEKFLKLAKSTGMKVDVQKKLKAKRAFLYQKSPFLFKVYILAGTLFSQTDWRVQNW